MIGDILRIERIDGRISEVQTINADVYAFETITAELSAVSAVTGALSDVSSIEGELSCVATIEATIEIPEALGGEYYDGDYEVTPDFDGRVLETKSKTMRDDIVVNPIQVSYTSDMSGGNTVYIGGLING